MSSFAAAQGKIAIPQEEDFWRRPKYELARGGIRVRTLPRYLAVIWRSDEPRRRGPPRCGVSGLAEIADS
jgi:hypothetical protein